MGSLWVIHRINSLRRPQIDQSANRSTQATRRIQTPICEHGRCQRKVQATPATNRAKWWYSAALSEFESPLLNGPQLSVNRKVQGSNPWSGASLQFGPDARYWGFGTDDTHILATASDG
jgi:hypothetical protein